MVYKAVDFLHFSHSAAVCIWPNNRLISLDISADYCLLFDM